VGHETIFGAIKEQQMNTTIALFKKELHTAKWFLLGGILFFWSFPLLDGIGTYQRSGVFRTDMPSGIVLVFGGLFAIITAGGIVCLDMPKGLYEFWRSRPVKLVPYIATKYLAGLAVILFVITLPLLLEIHVMRNADSINMASSQGCILYIHPWLVILIYSIAFFAGHILRNMTETVIISCAAMLLVYIIPVLVPVLEPLSFFSLLNFNVSGVSDRTQLLFYIIHHFWIFSTTALAMSLILLIGTWICMKRHVHFRFGLKTMCWCNGLVALILFSAAAFSIGSNLKCLARIPRPAPKEISPDSLGAFVGRGNVALIYHAGKEIKDQWISRTKEEPGYSYKQDIYRLEELFPLDAKTINPEIVAFEQKSETVFAWNTINESEQEKTPRYVCYFHIITLEDATRTARMASRLPLAEMKTKIPSPVISCGLLDSQKLFVQIVGEIIIIDISDNASPRILNRIAYPNPSSEAGGSLRFNMPSDNSLSAEKQRYMSHYVCRNSPAYSWDGDMYAEATGGLVCVYKIDKIDGNEIRMKKIAERKSLPLEKLIYSYPWKAVLKNNTLYVLQSDYSMTAYHMNEAAGTLKRIGHYAAPETAFFDIQIRQDGNIALMGGKIHVVQPPLMDKN
jgi:hypothetical protein